MKEKTALTNWKKTVGTFNRRQRNNIKTILSPTNH